MILITEIHLCSQFDPGISVFNIQVNSALPPSFLIMFYCFSWGVNYEEHFCLLTEMELKNIFMEDL